MANGGTLSQHESFSQFVQTHQGLVLGGGVIALLILAGMFMKSKQANVPTSTTADLSGLPEGKIYVPTQTSFSTENITTNTNSGNTTTTNPPSQQKGRRDPDKGGHKPPTVPQPPRPAGKALRWDQRHSVRGGETLSSIAAAQTRTLRAQGMPGNMTLTWHDLYAHNIAVITKYANKHGHYQNVWDWIFTDGEVLTVPRWG